MSKQAQLPDGTVLEFPDDTPDAVMDKVVKQHLGAKPEVAPKQDRSALNALALGAVKPVENLATAINWATGGIGDKFNALFGYPSEAETVRERNAMRSANSRTGFQALGNAMGTAPTLALPGGAFTQGAASGLLLTDRDTPMGIATDAAIGGIGGKVGEGLANAFAYALSPVKNKAGQLLYEAGIPQTIGQIARQGKGWGAKGLAAAEDALTSVPFLGDMINVARERGIEGFNTAIANRALKNIGESVPKGQEAGMGLVDYVGDRLSAKYQNLVPKLVGRYDQDFASDLMAAKAITDVLPDARQKQFAQIVYDVLGNRSQGAQISGQALKDAESRLTLLYKKFAKSTDADQTILADAIDGVRQALRSSVARSNPAQAAELQAINKGWAQLSTFRQAANAAGNATGVVTPAQMLAASRGGPRDELVRAAKEVLPSSVPDSGTARRAIQGVAASGALGATVNPALAIPAAGSMLYTKPATELLNAFVYANRPKGLALTADALRKLGRVAPAAVPALTASRAK